MTGTTTAPADVLSFEVGTIYYVRSIGDYDCVWSYRVIRRTAKFVTLEDVQSGETVRVGVSVWDGEETAMPHGRYSMAPTLRAGRVAA